MPRADVVVIGCGLSGLTAAVSAAQAGARVQILAKGPAGTHWWGGGMDVGVAPGARTAGEAVARLAKTSGHPYATLAQDVAPALSWLASVLAAQGLEYLGDLDTPLRLVPTSIGGTRPAAILPAAQAAAAREWQAEETLFVCGIAGFKDFWPEAIAASLERARVWGEGEVARPTRVVPVTVDLPDLAGRHNLNALVIARAFDDAAWRGRALDRIAAALEAAGARRGGGGGRVGLPAVVGLNDHPAAFDELRRRLPAEPFEMPLVPPSVPGVRLYTALRAALIAAGGRIKIGEPIADVQLEGGRVVAVATEAAARTTAVRAGAVILATGGISGGGILAATDGSLREVVFDLPVQAPERDDWFARDALDPEGHPLERAGIRVDADFRPLAEAAAAGDGNRPGHVIPENVRVVGGLLAGQRPFRERSRDGVDFTSGWRVGRALAGEAAAKAESVDDRAHPAATAQWPAPGPADSSPEALHR